VNYSFSIIQASVIVKVLKFQDSCT